MAKRGAATELTQENWAKEEEPEEMGSFRQATSEEMAGRQIKHARRRCLGVDSSTTSACKGLSAFTGFSVNKEAPSQPSFSFLSKNSSSESPAKPTFDFLNSSNNSTNPLTSKPGLSSSENKLSTQPFKFTQESVSSVPKTVELPKANGIEETKTSTDSLGKGGSKLFLAHLKALNEGVVLWVKEHLDKNPHVNLSPVFDDYKKHFEELTRKYPPASGSESESEVGSAAKSSKKDEASEKENKPLVSKEDSTESIPVKTFSFAGSTTASSEKSLETNKPLFTFGSSATAVEPEKNTVDSEEKSTFTFGGFESGNKKLETSIFGGSINSGGKGFVFGGLSSSQSALSAPSSFTFPSSTTPAAAEGGGGGGGDTDEPNDEPPEVEVNEVKEDDALYEKKCKLFYMKDGSYTEKGIGTLFLKPAGDKTQLVIRALTNLGNILLNIILNASIPTIRAGKNGVMIACVPNPPLAGKSESTEPVKMLIRVKTSEDADNLLEKINELKK
ncbi:nuclear pore complex protein Nup50 [Panulirus ornatus]|uniref:nuclear pore complex protein Nup50 n=1 Tax=Panulirus ornatus TaxID=150431 RepID=UPI003A8A1DC4